MPHRKQVGALTHQRGFLSHAPATTLTSPALVPAEGSSGLPLPQTSPRDRLLATFKVLTAPKPPLRWTRATGSPVLAFSTPTSQFSQFESSGGGCSDGEINLALMERRHSQQPVMDAIHHLAQTGGSASLLLTALSPSKCPKMSPVVRSLTF